MKHSEVIRYLERKTDSSRFFLVSNHGVHKEVVCHFFKSCLFWRLYNMMIDWHIHKEMINTIKLINITITSYNYLFFVVTAHTNSSLQCQVLLNPTTMLYIRLPEIIHLVPKRLCLWPIFFEFFRKESITLNFTYGDTFL